MKRCSEEKIISILTERQAGASVPDLSRRCGIAENTIYRWKSKFGGMEVSEAELARAALRRAPRSAEQLACDLTSPVQAQSEAISSISIDGRRQSWVPPEWSPVF